jgi:hypothetical protein
MDMKSRVVDYCGIGFWSHNKWKWKALKVAHVGMFGFG